MDKLTLWISLLLILSINNQVVEKVRVSSPMHSLTIPLWIGMVMRWWWWRLVVRVAMMAMMTPTSQNVNCWRYVASLIFWKLIITLCSIIFMKLFPQYASSSCRVLITLIWWRRQLISYTKSCALKTRYYLLVRLLSIDCHRWWLIIKRPVLLVW